MAVDPRDEWNDLEERLFMTLLGQKRKPVEERQAIATLWAHEPTKVSRAEMMDAIRTLVSQGLLAVRPGESGSIDVRDPHAMELTKRGFEFGQDLTAYDDFWSGDGGGTADEMPPLPEYEKPVFILEARKPAPAPAAPPADDRAAALEKQLAEMKAELEKLKAAQQAPVATATAPPPPPPPAVPALTGKALREGILKEFDDRERLQHGLVPIWQIRRALPAAPRADFDATLLTLQREDLVALVKLNDAREVPDDEIRDGLTSTLGNKLFFIVRGDKL